MSEILGLLFAAMVGLSLIPTYLAYQKNSTENIRGAATAQQQRIIYDAAGKYIEQNNVVVLANATPTVPVILTVAMLQTATKTQLPVTNPYGQTWQVQVLEPTPGTLQAFLTAIGGDTMPDKQAVKVSTLVGATGGFVPLNDSGAYPNGAANAWGAFGGWKIPLANYVGIVGGRPAALLTIEGGQVTNNYLYRNAVPGQSQLNTMNTGLNMGNNDIKDVSYLKAGAGFFSQDGMGTCCNSVGAALNISEDSQNTGRFPMIQMHSSGYTEGSIELNNFKPTAVGLSDGAPRLLLRNHQGYSLGLDASGAITAPQMAVPNGGNIKMGQSVFYGDDNNTVIYQNGSLSVLHPDGGAANLIGGNVGAYGSFYSQNGGGFGLTTRDGAGVENSEAGYMPGSINVNDIYIRSLGKWASQLGAGSFKQYINVGLNGTASSDGIIVVIGQSNTEIRATVDGVLRAYTAARDKYGQGEETITFPIKKGESWTINTAQSVRMMIM